LLLADTEWRLWSDREIARHCQVSNRFVGNIRRRLSVNGSQMRTPRVRRGESVYEMDTKSIGGARPPSARITSTESPQPVSSLLCSSCPFWCLFADGRH
jgi:hypothetical protein